MTIPHRGHTSHSTYFITAGAFQKKNAFQTDRMAALLVEVLHHYRSARNYLLHEFVVMPNHIHLLITPQATLARSMQLVKGGFSYRARKELDYCWPIWQTSFFDRRVRDAGEYGHFRDYIHQNPVRRGLAECSGQYEYSSANRRYSLDAPPQRLKPLGEGVEMQG
jgi:putative transposase